MSDNSLLWDLWEPYAGDSAQSRDEWIALIERWSEPQRDYHSLAHLLHMLVLLAERGASEEVMVAAWYHDAVYDPQSATNEADSAALAEAALARLGKSELAPRVAALILATATHDAPAADADALLLLDADLAILAEPPANYLRYVEGIRREYAHVPDDEFCTARSAILQGFLDRPAIYRHPAFADRESAARTNLAAELAVYAGQRKDAEA